VPRTVVRIIDRLNVGGPALHAVLTARGLDPARYRTVLVLGSVEPGEADMGYLLDGANVEHVVIPSLGRELRPLRDLYTAWRLFRVLRALKPDVVHTHKAKAGALGRVVALLCRVPVRVHTYHGHVFHGYFGPAKTRLFVGIERALAPLTSRLVALSDELADELAGRYSLSSRARFTVVPLGLELGPFTAARRHQGTLRARVGAAPEAPLVGIVGRMVPVKDHRSFVAAAQLIAERRPQARFVFIGGGELEADVRAQADRCGILSQCHFLGWQRELAPLYADLDALALSSVNEGTPVALIEAMAAGVPVAATAVGGVADLLRHGARGELAPPSDPAALAQAIERALTPEAAARAARQRAEVAAEHGAARLCDDLARLYDELLDHQ
jgi:glycosyltransferase involved in cell wall biosynthesis